MITYYLHRWLMQDNGIIGDFCRGSDLVCFSLEPPAKRLLHPAIPKGEYPISWTYSPSLQRNTPRLLVKDRSGILIHAGNTIEDTEGCILVGKSWTMNADKSLFLQYSRQARDEVYNLIQADLNNGSGFADLVITEG